MEDKYVQKDNVYRVGKYFAWLKSYRNEDQFRYWLFWGELFHLLHYALL